MSQARATGVFLGTDETTGVTIANNASSAGSEVTIFSDDATSGWMIVYLKFTSTVTAGTLDVWINHRRVSGQSYKNVNASITIKPINGTALYILGVFPASRYMNGEVLNNGTGASATNVTLGYEVYKSA